MCAWLPDRSAEGMVRLGEVEEPRPAPHEALVRVAAYSVNRGETLLLERPRPHWRPGKDVAGVVVAAAADGSGPPVGTSVVGHPPAGGWARSSAVASSDLAVLPDGFGFAAAAALPLAGLTALRLVREAGPLQGRRLLVTGASGGVGHYVVELAAAAGAEVTALSGSAQRGERLLELGAHHVASSVPAASAPYDVVMESIGGRVFSQALARVRPDGLLLWFGQASRTPVTTDFFDFFTGPVGASIRHFDYTRGGVSFGEDLRTLVRLTSQGCLHPELGLVDSWTQTATAIELLRARQVRGNVVMLVDQ